MCKDPLYLAVDWTGETEIDHCFFEFLKVLFQGRAINKILRISSLFFLPYVKKDSYKRG